MSPEQNKAIALKFYEIFDQQDTEKGRELISADIIAQGLDVVPVEGIDAVMAYGAMMFSAFPDGRHVLGEVIAEGDKVFTRGTFSGTHQGELMGMPASGKSVNFSVVHIDRIVDGKVVEHWGQGDTLTMMKQLGIIFFPGPKLILRMLRRFVLG
ncbi:ester cyclase [Acaryochloris thomasi]|nr:ester cyclase [Acaryochloris thomasi]